MSEIQPPPPICFGWKDIFFVFIRKRQRCLTRTRCPGFYASLTIDSLSSLNWRAFALFRSPFTFSVIRCDRETPSGADRTAAPLKDTFASVGFESYQCLTPNYTKMTAFASKMLCAFGATYLCQQAFLVMNINKSKRHRRLTSGHQNDIMKISEKTAQKLVPDVDSLVKA